MLTRTMGCPFNGDARLAEELLHQGPLGLVSPVCGGGPCTLQRTGWGSPRNQPLP